MDFLRKSGNTPQSRFNVTLGQEYLANAMALWTYGLGVLIVDDTGRPNWKPIGLFDVTDRKLPDDWEFTAVRDRDPLVALWGYPALIRDPNHHDDLIERKSSALEVFLREAPSPGGDSH
ncbi:hypothetical protein [Streptomyces sp. NBC_00094]|uniref:hypothetical protein n=1 Tax=Streptomyces sp. NBC_00094 TaxID=2903620 RepID=UPI00225421BB|nr:hypothetical protein [Streptomyces sp. NBC_00094]MCX5395345.1 hypothetical protein [Streptomyces sp. NBC_00094]